MSIDHNLWKVSTVRSPKEMAYRAAWSEEALIKDLKDADAELIEVKSFDDRPQRQLSVRFPDGEIGVFYPGGPSKRPAYSYHEGHRPGDEHKPSIRWSELQ